MPNTANIDKLIEAIKAKPTHFKMDEWKTDGDLLHDCGTVACLGGWSNVLSGHLGKEGAGAWNNDDVAAAWLGITKTQANQLFYMDGPDQRANFDCAEPDARVIAADRVLKVLRDEGRVDWPQALDAAGLASIIEPEERDYDKEEGCDCEECRPND
jgi:hypothetical protein